MQSNLAEVARLAVEAEINLLKAGGIPLDKIVGARTQAIHDFVLLSGDATERTENVGPDEFAKYLHGAWDAYTEEREKAE
jgi:hypothetical protein